MRTTRSTNRESHRQSKQNIEQRKRTRHNATQSHYKTTQRSMTRLSSTQHSTTRQRKHKTTLCSHLRSCETRCVGRALRRQGAHPDPPSTRWAGKLSQTAGQETRGQGERGGKAGGGGQAGRREPPRWASGMRGPKERRGKCQKGGQVAHPNRDGTGAIGDISHIPRRMFRQCLGHRLPGTSHHRNSTNRHGRIATQDSSHRLRGRRLLWCAQGPKLTPAKAGRAAPTQGAANRGKHGTSNVSLHPSYRARRHKDGGMVTPMPP